MRVVTAWQVKDLALKTAAVFGLYVFSYFLVWAIITPAQEAIIPEITKYASLLFLPHGIRVFATSLLGAESVPGIFFGEFVGNYLFWDISGGIPMFIVLTAGGIITYVVFEALKAAGVNAYYLHVTSQPPPLRTFMLAGILASALNAFIGTSILEGYISFGHVTSELAAFMTGDVTGLIAVIMIAKLVIPIINARMQQGE